eukprot:gene15700-18617_t
MTALYGVTDSLFPRLASASADDAVVVTLRCVDVFSRMVIYAMNNYVGVYAVTHGTECIERDAYVTGAKLSGFRPACPMRTNAPARSTFECLYNTILVA